MSYLDHEGPIAMAHRGGALLPENAGIENTRRAFQHAVDLGFTYLETDVHRSIDGVVYAFHDLTLERFTGEPRGLAELTSAEIDSVLLDAREPIPRLGELLEAFPTTRFNIDLKDERAVEATVALLREHDAVDRVLLSAFDHGRIQRTRALLPEVVTGASPLEVGALLTGVPVVASLGRRHGAVAVQVPRRRGRVPIVTDRFVRRAHRHGLQVHVWTVDDPAEMTELLDQGVDALITDRPDLLRDVLTSRGEWP